ncbi:transposase [Candidatus Hydrogenedentota bacterium]
MPKETAQCARETRGPSRTGRVAQDDSCRGEVTALTWALEVVDPHRFSTVNRAVSYCGLCSAQRESAGKSTRGPV